MICVTPSREAALKGDAKVRDASGRANVAITSGHSHVAVDEDEVVGDLFGTAR
jgi:hypothetical protein